VGEKERDRRRERESCAKSLRKRDNETLIGPKVREGRRKEQVAAAV
jgi:hypothetical protein